ncbi:hypothetical protein [Microvirga subterranea]|uniref:Uncharacterized protein n=1 Tax=Microvirga subterranea TaxID=186651 RepID=A0A370HQZ6_9HYPH|nr:hypothetical protein [Microvirga subterranea]RDI60957.1 hypothetical protein DES45_102346 [Microvirga subterranea]
MTTSDKPQMKNRIEEITTSMSPEQESAIRILANELHRVNEAVMNCVYHGLSVELQRVKRFHSEEGFWGDMIVPVIVKQKGS